jgi:tripartite ATP-independent transporter DctM subunit
MIALIVCLLLILLMVIGVPVCVAMGATSAGVFAAMGHTEILAVMAQRIYNGTTGFTLLAIPFFILAGNLMNTGGITDRIYNFANAMVGRWPGGLGQVNVFGSVLFAGMSGAAVADAAGLGAIEIKAMDDAGYDHTFSSAITAASSTIAPVIPPSIPFVIYSTVTGVSVARLFAAGIIPGLLMALSMSIVVYIIAKRRNFPVSPPMPWKLRLKYFWQAIPSLFTVVIIIGGIWTGIFTATEAAIVATVYALILSSIVYKQLNWKKLGEIIYDSLLTSCKTLFIIAIANFLAYFMLHQRIPNQVIDGLMSVTSNPHIHILLMIFVLVVLGCFLEGVSVILITAPIFLPIVDAIGMDYVQFGVIMVLASMIGLLTPPVGMSLYAVCSVAKIKLAELSKAVLPYVIGIFIVLLLCAFWEPLSMWLPSLIG